jgi:hypothetical protein
MMVPGIRCYHAVGRGKVCLHDDNTTSGDKEEVWAVRRPRITNGSTFKSRKIHATHKLLDEGYSPLQFRRFSLSLLKHVPVFEQLDCTMSQDFLYNVYSYGSEEAKLKS